MNTTVTNKKAIEISPKKNFKISKSDYDNGFVEGYEEQGTYGKRDTDTLLNEGQSFSFIKGYQNGWQDAINDSRKGNKLDFYQLSGIVGTCRRKLKGETFYFFKTMHNGRLGYIPKQPDRYFTATGEWKGWDDFLGIKIR